MARTLNNILCRICNYHALLACALLWQGCAQELHVGRLRAFELRDEKNYQVISINPTLTGIALNGSAGKEVGEKLFHQILVENAGKNGLQLQIAAPSSLQQHDLYYFEDLAPLRNEMLHTIYLQQFDALNAPTEREKQGTILTLYQKAPKLFTDYSKLYALFGTRYFLVQGISPTQQADYPTPANALPQEVIYFALVADVLRSEIVYQEHRKLKPNMSVAYFNSVLFDSFKLIAN